MTTKAELFEPLDIAHYKFVSAERVKQDDGTVKWMVRRSLVLPATVGDLKEEKHEEHLEAHPDAVAQIELLIKTFVIPVDAVTLKVNVAP